MFKRPHREEDEDDLLRFQEEFLKAKENASAKVVKPAVGSEVKKEAETDRDVVSLELPQNFPVLNPPRKKSKFKEDKERLRSRNIDQEDAEERLEKHDQHITKVLSSIIEHNECNVKASFPSPMATGFPTVYHRQTQINTDLSSKRSIFAQQFQEIKDSEPMDTESEKDTALMSKLVDGSGLTMTNAGQEAEKISRENRERLAAMSQADILAEQKMLLEMIDPKLVSFIKSRTQTEAAHKKLGVSDNSPHLTPSIDDSHKPKESVKASEPIAEDELPVKPNVDWVNMDKVETDKLQWMKNLPKPTANTAQSGQQARFDLQGKPLMSDSNVPVHMGLHHHGDEPERPGYTLEELFTLARSANIQQKALALQIIAKIIKSAKHGELLQVVQTPLLSSLIDGGLVFLLRWALDDTPDIVMSASVAALSALVVNEMDEACLDETFSWHHGYSLPPLCPSVSPANSGAGEEEDEAANQKTDAEIVKEDVIRGLLQMSLLTRLRYILEVWRPQAQTVLNILDILIRVSRHSMQSAYEVFNCPRLMDTLFKEFLPGSWDMTRGVDPSNVYGIPVRRALKLMRIISTAGRNMCAMLISKHDLPTLCLTYLATEESALPLATEESYKLKTECLRMWQICLSYGFTSDTLRDAYSLLMERVQQFPSSTLQEREPVVSLTSAMLGVIEASSHLAASTYSMERKLVASQKQGSADSQAQPIPAIHWSHVTGFMEPVQMCLKNWCKEFIDNYHFKKFNLSLFSSCTHLLASYYAKAADQPGFDAVLCLQQMESLYDTLLLPLLQSPAFSALTGSLIDHSMMLCNASPFSQEAPSNLPSVGSACVKQEEIQLSPLLSKYSPFNALIAICRLLTSMYKLHKGLRNTAFQLLLQDGGILSYLRRVCTHRELRQAANYWCKFENMFQYYLVKIASLKPLCDSMLYHQVSLSLLTRLQPGHDHFAHDLLSNVIFSDSLVEDTDSSNSGQRMLSELHLDEKKEIISASQQSLRVDRTALLIECTKSLANIRYTYLMTLGKKQSELMKSRSQLLSIPQEVGTLLAPSGGQLLVPRDWMFLPIVELYQTTGESKEIQASPKTVSLTTSCLYWILYLESCRHQVMQSVSITTRISRLMCIFLIGNELFLEPAIQHLLAALLQLYCLGSYLDRMNFDEQIPGLSSFYDLYLSFLLEYEAASFGDSVFSCFILLPIQQRHNKMYRRLLWTEHTAALRSLFIPLDQVLIPVKNFLEPEECDVELIRFYLQSLLASHVTPSFCPLLYLVAVHHVNKFMYLRDGASVKLKQAMLKSVQNSSNQELKHHLTFYKSMNLTAHHGMELYPELPAGRKVVLSEVAS